MPKFKRSKSELQNELTEQLAMLRASAEGFDKGNLWEAKRLATVSYTLLHDGTGRTRSLLSQLDIRNKIKYMDSVDDDHHHALRNGDVKNYLPFSPLVIIEFDTDNGTTKIAPRLNRGFRGPITRTAKNFNSWWEGIIHVADNGESFSRKNLVFTLRTQDGGSHYDPEIRSETYRDFSTVWTRRIGFHDKSGPIIPNAHLASMRQISWELEKGISNYFC